MRRPHLHPDLHSRSCRQWHTRRIGSLVVIIGLSVASCATPEPGGYEVADRVLGAVGEPIDEVTSLGPPSDEESAGAAEEECTVIETTDEYGFTNEVSTCPLREPTALASVADDEADPVEVLAVAGDLPNWVYDSFLARAPDSARAHLDPMGSTLDALDRSCGVDVENWLAALEQLVAQVEGMTDAISDGELDGYLGTPEAKVMSRALMERSLLGTRCAEPARGSPLASEQLVADGTLTLTSQAALSLSELGRLMDAGLLGYLFHFFTTADNYAWLRTQPQSLDVVVYGTSQAGAGIDVPLLDRELSLTVGNAFLSGSLAEVQQHWFPEVERYIDPQTVVWLMGPIDLVIDCDPAGRPEQFLERLTRRRRTFANPGWFSEIDPLDVVLGPPGPENTNRGNAAKKPAPVAAEIEAHSTDYRDRLANAGFCHQRAATIKSSIARMIDEGRNVVVVGMPLSPLAYEHLPDGATTASSAIETLQTEHLDGLEVAVVDLSSALQDRPELWVDYTHLTESGATTFTTLLAAELKRLEP